MILRVRSGASAPSEGAAEDTTQSSLRGRVAAYAVAGVTVAVGMTALFSYFAVSGAIKQNELLELDSRTVALMRQTRDVLEEAETNKDDANREVRFQELVDHFRTDNPGYLAAVSPGVKEPFIGDALPIDRMAVQGQKPDWAHLEFQDEWVSVLRAQGATVVLGMDSSTYSLMVSRLKATLIGIAGLGTLLAAFMGLIIARVTVRPLERLRRSIDGVVSTEELEPIEVIGQDEYGRLTESLNDMMETLKDSRVRQSQLVADAGHELRTPLTSMRTNIELLMMLHRSGQVDTMAPEDLADLEADVMAQMEEMSTLIGDLVDLAREDGPQQELQPARLDEIISDSLERVQRRRPDVDFRVRLDPWLIDADVPALSRAPVNLLDNAAKWSPPGGVVRVSLRAAQRRAVLIIDDSGPGIPADEREKVFERFYRAPESRAMPGSGLGLAITRQVLERHGATISVDESDDGGTRIRIIFPGEPVTE
ncbi:sensor histidine kinase [Corynebacterium meitnerae]|uniref:histidine kinase n=1 Tax=Corynebacterium meitnerae TaxID=2913498 RepID=A0A9X3LT51_9CORY|nr:HAMP domain-containing histidine kinase [Corynebacterium meitnerae]